MKLVRKDVCEALGLEDHKVAVRKLDEDERGECSIPSLGGEQRTLVISESGLYALVLRCRDADKMLAELGIGKSRFGSFYLTEQNKIIRLLNLPKRECLILVSGYSVEMLVSKFRQG